MAESGVPSAETDTLTMNLSASLKERAQPFVPVGKGEVPHTHTHTHNNKVG